MAITLLASLQADKAHWLPLSDATAVESMPLFLDLYWDRPVDRLAALDDPCVQFRTTQRQLVLARVNGEIRYYAASVADQGDDARSEIGVLPDEQTALAFGYLYLIEQRSLSDIPCQRNLKEW